MGRKYSGVVVDYHNSLDAHREYLETFRVVRVGLHVHADCRRTLRARENALRPRLPARVVHRPVYQKNLYRPEKTGVLKDKVFSVGFMGDYDGNIRHFNGMGDTERRGCIGQYNPYFYGSSDSARAPLRNLLHATRVVYGLPNGVHHRKLARIVEKAR